MIHDPWPIAMGGSDDMRDAADEIDRQKAIIVNIYAQRSGQDADAIAAMMTAETYMSASDAVDERLRGPHRPADGRRGLQGTRSPDTGALPRARHPPGRRPQPGARRRSSERTPPWRLPPKAIPTGGKKAPVEIHNPCRSRTRRRRRRRGRPERHPRRGHPRSSASACTASRTPSGPRASTTASPTR